MKNVIASVILSAMCVATVACGPSVTLQTPSGFAVLADQKEYVYRAASADNVVIGVRAEKNEPKGPLEFWAGSLDNQLRRSGYVREGEPAEVRTRTGLVGRELKYTRQQGGRPYRLWIAVFVTNDRVWVVEAGGDADRFKEKQQKGVQEAIASLGIG